MGKERDRTKEGRTTVDSKHIEQHLANERTFLAWIRTAIAIIGVGFLVSNIHFSMKGALSQIGNLLGNIIGIASVGLGIVTIIMATIVYLRKLTSINNQTFVASKRYIISLSIFIIIIAFLFVAYFLLV